MIPSPKDLLKDIADGVIAVLCWVIFCGLGACFVMAFLAWVGLA